MKKNYLIAILAAAAVTAVSLAGCGGQAAPSPAAPESSAASAATSSAETPAENSSAAESAAESEAASSAEAAPSADFEARFAENKLDSDYEAQMGTAYTTREIISVANTFAGLWQTEVSNGYTQLLAAVKGNAKSEIEDDQKDWNDGLEEALAKVRQSISGDGSTVQVEQAIAVKDFYRSKAKELYAKLYQYQPDFTLAYAPY